MAYNNESIGAAPWKPEYGARVFKYDALLSYRRADAQAAHRLADLLRNAGLALWWDENGDEDLADGQLIEKIGHAVFHSRYIIVCVGIETSPSEWMSAEFAAGLASEKKWGYKRVLVARMDSQVEIPAELARCVAFEVEGDSSAELAEYAKSGNRFDFEPEEVKTAVSNEFVHLADAPAERRSTPSNVELLFGLPWRIDMPEASEFNQSLQSMRCSVDRMDRSELEGLPGLSSMLLRACADPAFSEDNDNRANAIGTMARLAEFGSRDAVARLTFFLSVERNPSVISMAFRWISKHFDQMEGGTRSVVLLAVATASTFADGRLDDACLSSLPEAIQCRVRTGRDLDPKSLSVKERLALASRRIDLLLEQSPYGANRMSFWTEVERLKGAAFSFYKYEPHPKAVHPELISDAFDVIERMIERSWQREGYPFCALESPFDQLLTPIAMCYADGQYPERAARLLESACDLLSAYGKRGNSTVAAFRSLLTELQQGKTFDQVYAQLSESLYQASKLDDNGCNRLSGS